MGAITRESLLSLEAYAKARGEFRQRVLAHKKARTVHLGEHVTLLFEDELTVRYQIQEMLRIEKVFEEAGIQDELEAYNPLVPDGANFKATMLIEYEDPDERVAALSRLTGIERRVWIEVEGHPRVFAIADEDLPRETETKTAAVHFLRFELDAGMVSALERGAGLAIGVDHPVYDVGGAGGRAGDAIGARGRPRLGDRSPRCGRRCRAVTTAARRRSHASRSIDHTRNSSAGPSRCGRVTRRTSDIPHFASTRPDAGLRARCVACSDSTSRCENASATSARAAAVA